MITFQAQAFGDRGEQKLPGYEGCHTSASPQASFDIFQQLVLLISLVGYDSLFGVGPIFVHER